MSKFTELWTVKLSDWERGLVVAVLTVPLGILYDWATITDYQLNWRSIVKGAVVGFVAYITKNFSTGSGGNVLTNSSKSIITGKQNTDK